MKPKREKHLQFSDYKNYDKDPIRPRIFFLHLRLFLFFLNELLNGRRTMVNFF